MGLFRPREVADPVARSRLSDVEADLARMASAIRQLEVEQATMHDQVRKWMRRAVAAERHVTHEGAGTPPPAVAPVTGVRARRALRRWQESQVTVTTAEDDPGSTNGAGDGSR